MKRNAQINPKNIGLNCLISLMAILLTLLLGEVLVRIFSPQQLTLQNNKIWMPDSQLGWKKAPFVNEFINTGEQTVSIVTDSLGYRINKNPVTGKECQQVILFLGDSFLESLQVENEDTYPELLCKKLNKKRTPGYCAVNTGVGGWEPSQYYLQAKLELERKHYNLVVVGIFLGNDFIQKFDTIIPPRQPIRKHSLRLPKSLEKRELQTALWKPVKNYLSARSHLFVLLKKSVEYYAAKETGGQYIEPQFLKANDKAGFWEVTLNACKHLQELANRKKTPLVFCFLPTTYQVDERLFFNYLKAAGVDKASVDLELPNRIFGKMLAEGGMRVADPLPFFREQGKKGTLFGKIDRHFNELGHFSVAEFIYPLVDSILQD